VVDAAKHLRANLPSPPLVTIAAVKAEPAKKEIDMLRDFKTFLLRGNVVDLAVGIVIGAAFSAVIKGLVADLLTPIIAAIIGKPDFSSLAFTINGSHFLYGSFINDLISFVSVAAALFFFVVQPVNALMARRRTEPDVASETAPCPQCLSDVPKLARKCAFCGSALQPAPAAPAG
jgi:large conductance mechanosensitive channel